MGKTIYYTYTFDFSLVEKGTMARFISLYKDLFHSWAEEGIKRGCTTTHFDKPLPKLYGQKYRHYETSYDAEQEKRMREGFWIQGDILEIHCAPEGFRSICEVIKTQKISNTRKHGRTTYRLVPNKAE